MGVAPKAFFYQQKDGKEIDDREVNNYHPGWPTYANHSQSGKVVYLRKGVK